MLDKCIRKLKTLLETDNEFASVFDYEPSNLDATPICTITQSSNTAAFRTTTENDRVYALTVRIFVKRATGEENERLAEEALRQIVDSVIDTVDRNHQMSGLETQTGYTFILVKAAPSVSGYVKADTQYRTADIEVRFVFSVDVNSIT